MREGLQRVAAAPRKRGAREWAARKSEPRRLDAVPLEEAARVSLDGGPLDAALNGGAVAGSVLLVSGPPGVGKSTRSLVWCERVARTLGGDALYLSAEMSEAEVRATAERAGVSLSRVWVWEARDVVAALAWARTRKVRALVVDSLPLVEVPGEKGPKDTRRRALAELLSARSRVAVTFVLVHATKEGEPEGDRWEEHAVTCSLYLDAEGAVVRKHRHGPSGARVRAELGPLLPNGARAGAGEPASAGGVAGGVAGALAELDAVQDEFGEHPPAGAERIDLGLHVVEAARRGGDGADPGE